MASTRSEWLMRQLRTVTPGSTIWRSNAAQRAADDHRDRRDWAQAERHYKTFLQLNPERGDIWIQLGHTLKEQQRLSEAFDAYKQANTANPQDADALLHMGYAKLIAGDHLSAIDHFLDSAHLGDREASAMAQKLVEEHRLEGYKMVPVTNEVPFSVSFGNLPFRPEALGSGAFSALCRMGTKSSLYREIDERIAFYRAEIPLTPGDGK